MLVRVISGGQTGADIGGVKAGKAKGLETGGWMPSGFKTQDGNKPEYAELYGMQEHSSDKYPPRTFQNAKESDATIRIAKDINSSGEKCTLKAINQYKKLHFDVLVTDTKQFNAPMGMHPKDAAQWIVDNNIKILNVAGNSENTAPGMESYVFKYISAMIDEIKTIEHHQD